MPGSGLGLAIVAQAVETDGGTVEAQNLATGGSEFKITFPTLQEQGDGAIPVAPMGPVRIGNCHRQIDQEGEVLERETRSPTSAGAR